MLFIICFVTSWFIFAIFWYLIVAFDDSECVIGITSFVDTILFSIETQQTIGFGTRSLTDRCASSVILLIFQSCFSVLIQALWVGLIYTKLSRPKKRRRTILWSENAVISLRNGFLTFQCRLADMRLSSTLVEAHIRMYFISKCETKENEIIPLNLIDMNVGFDRGTDRLILNWPTVIEHKIDEQSPLFHVEKDNLFNLNFEILVILEGIIEPTGMLTQIKTSYLPNEIVWGGRFETMIYFSHDHYFIDFAKFNQIYQDNLTKHYSAKQLQQDFHVN